MVSPATVEIGSGALSSTLQKLQHALEVQFIDENGGGAGVRLRKRRSNRCAWGLPNVRSLSLED